MRCVKEVTDAVLNPRRVCQRWRDGRSIRVCYEEARIPEQIGRGSRRRELVEIDGGIEVELFRVRIVELSVSKGLHRLEKLQHT